MNLVEFVNKLLFSIPALSEAESMQLLSGISGRGIGSYGSKLSFWLESNSSIYPEPVLAENTDHLTEAGVDVLLTGKTTKTRVGFQIKTDNDFKNPQFTLHLKAQLTESKQWGLSAFIIILACRPTQKNQDKYLHIFNQYARLPDGYVQIITPQRAAALLQSFDRPLIRGAEFYPTWVDFLNSVGQTDLIHQHLDPWRELKPDQRFEPPAEFEELLKSVEGSPLTVLSGPPAVGKTFCAMQILWQKFRNNQDVEWIAPVRFTVTDGVIPNVLGPIDMPQRIELLVRQLGVFSGVPPLDATDFIAKHLRPRSIVYIEDPFGKSDDEFEVSLHTYSFLDFDKFVAEITECAHRQGCRILVSTREALFERWLHELEKQNKKVPSFSLVNITRNSYTYEQKVSLARKLVLTRDCADPERLAEIIASYSDVPFDAEIIVREVPDSVTIQDVIRSAKKSEGNNVDKVRNRIVAETDSERLFLLLQHSVSCETNAISRESAKIRYLIIVQVICTAMAIEWQVATGVTTSML